MTEVQDIPVDKMNVIHLDRTLGMDLLSVYSGLSSLSDYAPNKIPNAFKQLDDALAPHAEFYAVAKLPMGNVDMGTPLIFEPSIYGIHAPDEWNEEYNLKLVLFAVNVRDYLSGVEEIDVVVTLPDDCIAVDLVPLSYTDESANTITEAQQSRFGTTIFGGELTYQRRLKPVIQGSGLQSNEFGWQLRGKALGVGTTSVVALVRAPKELKKVNMRSAFVLREPNSWIAQGGIGSSEPALYVITF
jgi:hypothetical protein